MKMVKKPEENTLNFSDDESMDEGNFIDDSEEESSINVYRKLDPHNLEHYNRFPNQTRNPISAVYEDDEMYFGEEDSQPELYIPEDRESVHFENFSGFEKSIKKFYNLLKNFENIDHPFFDSIAYGLMHKVAEGKINLKQLKN